MSPSWPRSSAVVERIAGAAVCLLVIWVYSGAVQHHRMPPGHPWSGLSLGIIGALAVLWPAGAGRPSTPATRWMRLGLVVAAIVFAGLWFREAAMAPEHLPA